MKKKLTKKQKIAIAIAFATVCAGGVMYSTAIHNSSVESTQNNNPPELYHIPNAERVFIDGIVKPKSIQVFNTSSHNEEINKVNVKDGDYVEKNKVLYSCKNQSIIEQIDSIELQISNKKKELNNTDDELLSQSLKNEIAVLSSNIDELDKKVYTYTYAPFSGTIHIKKSESGEQIITLQSTEFYIEGTVNEYDLFKISENQEVELMIYATKENINGKIVSIDEIPSDSASLSQSELTNYNVKIDTPTQENLKHGLHVQGTSLYAEDSIIVPISAIVEEGDKTFVYVVENEVFKKTEVIVLEKDSETAVIGSGVKQGTSISRNPMQGAIVDGQSIFENNDSSTGGN